MSETAKEKLDRVRMMADGGDTWDLSDNDVAALQYSLDYIDKQAKEIEQLRARVAELEEAIRVCTQAICEIDHARRNPDWFTRGESAAWQQTTLWIDRAVEAIRAAKLKGGDK